MLARCGTVTAGVWCGHSPMAAMSSGGVRFGHDATDSLLHQVSGRSPRAVLHCGPQVAVGVQCRGRGGVAQGSLDGDDIAARCNETRRVEVPEVVQPDVRQLGGCARGSPAPGDVVSYIGPSPTVNNQAWSAPILGGLLDPGLDVGAADGLERQIAEWHRPNGQVRVCPGRWQPELSRCPVGVELVEGGPACVGFDPGAVAEAGGDVVEPALSINAPSEVT